MTSNFPPQSGGQEAHKCANAKEANNEDRSHLNGFGQHSRNLNQFDRHHPPRADLIVGGRLSDGHDAHGNGPRDAMNPSPDTEAARMACDMPPSHQSAIRPNPTALVEALRRLQSAQEDAEKASVMCQSRDWEICHHAVLDERVETFRIANLLGLDMRVIERAVQ